MPSPQPPTCVRPIPTSQIVSCQLCPIISGGVSSLAKAVFNVSLTKVSDTPNNSLSYVIVM